MENVLSMDEIQSLYKSEWVLLEDPDLDETLSVKSGTVLCHSKDRDEVYRKARELRPKHSAILYTGTIDEDVAVVL